MYITIYFGEKPVFLCDRRETSLKTFYDQSDTILMKDPSSSGVHSLLQEIEKSGIRAGIIESESFELLKKNFFSVFTIITAGGGVVCNDLQEILLIFRRGKWDLPKGKLDDGESIEECAVREVIEETGLETVSITDKLPDTYHTYKESGKNMIKHSCWFSMHAPGQQSLLPQTEEDITEIRWVPLEQVSNYFTETYPSVRDILNKYLALSL